MTMNDTEFNDLIEQTFAVIEDAVDSGDADTDCELSGGVLTLMCENGSSIIFSRQVASQELWIAARSGGYHLVYQNGQWYCQKHQQSLKQLVATITKDQTGETLELD